jgi:uncharacterized membrane protein YedE/YeeE
MNNAPKLIAALAAGILFGFGLSVAQMIDPAKVVGFLDLFGQWDPSLAFVMGGGLLVNAILTPLILKQSKPIYAELFQVPTRSDIDPRLVVGGGIFGIGWGLAGYCPGPMLTSLSFFNADIVTIVVAYLVGTFITKWYLNRPQLATA